MLIPLQRPCDPLSCQGDLSDIPPAGATVSSSRKPPDSSQPNRPSSARARQFRVFCVQWPGLTDGSQNQMKAVSAPATNWRMLLRQTLAAWGVWLALVLVFTAQFYLMGLNAPFRMPWTENFFSAFRE